MTTAPYAHPNSPGLSGPHPIYMNIEYPFMQPTSDQVDYSRAILNIEFSLDGTSTKLDAEQRRQYRKSPGHNLIWTQVAFINGHVMAFYEKPPPQRGCWVIRGGYDKMTEDHTQFITLLGTPSDTVDPDDFWIRFNAVISRPEVLLDIAARQAMESMKDL